MRTRKTQSIPSSASVAGAASLIIDAKTRCLPVVNGNKVIGVLSEGDILRALLKGSSLQTPITSLIRIDFIYLTEGCEENPYEIMKIYDVTMIPIVDANMCLVKLACLGDS